MDQTEPDIAQQFRAIAELRGDVAWIVRADSGLPVYISPGVHTLLGYDMDDFVEHFSSPEPSSPLFALCAGLAARLQRFAQGDLSRKDIRRSFDQPHRDGHLVPIEVVSTILVARNGVANAVVGTIRDVSEQRQRAEQQRRFASMLNHEFRTPLSTIDGAIQRLEVTGAGADEATRSRYRKIQGAVDRLIGMMDNYLSPERMGEAGITRPDDAVAPSALLEEAAVQLRAAGREAIVDIGELPDRLRCQPSGLRLALKVLIDNALTYSPAQRPIHLSAQHADGGIVLRVRDGGDGVPEAELRQIFNKGYRASNAIGAGSGLGLYMARSVIEVHGGNINVQNVPDFGAEFEIWLPAHGGGGKSVASNVSNCDNSAKH
ncbi:MAG: PAS domain-containing sensor histidine kinase [Pseudomonadota bacterium]